MTKSETIDRICGDLEIVQSKDGYRFGMESLFLCGFVKGRFKRALDLGTGSGVIPLVLTRYGKVDSMVGVEIQPSLAGRAHRSVAKNKMSHCVEVIQADIRCLDGIFPPGGFELVVSNPPHGGRGTGHVNPNKEKAIGKHEITCTLSDVVSAAARLLGSKGSFDLVVPPRRLMEALRLCEEHRLRPKRLRMVHGRIDLKPKNCLLEAQKGRGANLEVEPPLIIYGTDGEYTEEARRMLYPSLSESGSLDPERPD
jgi:tRNA1Val (adenine37-N6)-methyltransferase